MKHLSSNPSWNLIFILIPFFQFLFQACDSSSNQDYAETPPNLIIILTDDLGYGDVGFNGCTDIPTPNIDRIAKEGVIFTNGYVSYPVCGPSRAGLITGRYQGRFGFGRNPLFAPNDPMMGLPLSEETLADALKQANYKSAVLGKWHLGAHPSQRPLERGFNDFFGFLTGGHRYFPEEWTLADEYEVNSQYAAYKTKLLRNEERVEESEYLTDALSREAVSYIKKYQEEPFFIYLAYNAPHAPMQATEKYMDRFDHIEDKKRKTYAAMVSAVDDGVGRILDQLESSGIAENTLVIFLSDNGGPEHINASDNGPLRGKKGDLFEGGIRVPFAMRWPAQISAGTVFEKQVISLDIFATIVAQNKGNIHLKNPIDGVDLLPHLQGENADPPHEILYWRKFDQNKWAVRQGEQKVIRLPEGRQFYDLDEDLGEENDKSIEGKAILENVTQLQEKWNQEMMDPIFMGLLLNKDYDKLNQDRFKRPKSK